jgi:superfamily I DNA/RNA helicase
MRCDYGMGVGLLHSCKDTSIGTVHLAKALEFRAVTVAALNDEIILLAATDREIGDDADLKEITSAASSPLCRLTRAQDHLLVTGVTPVSGFLDNLK